MVVGHFSGDGFLDAGSKMQITVKSNPDLLKNKSSCVVAQLTLYKFLNLSIKKMSKTKKSSDHLNLDLA